MKRYLYRFVLLLVVLVFTGCEYGSGIEESAVVDDKEEMSRLLVLFDEMDVDYRLDGNRIWFSVKDKDKVRAAKAQLWPQLNYLGRVVIFGVKDDAVAFSRFLQANGFDSDIIRYGEEFAVGWDRVDDSDIRTLYATWGGRVLQK